MQETENRSPEIFNEQVQIILEDYVCQMLRDLAEYRRKAELCGCPQCKKHLQSLEEECEREAERLTHIPAMDHESELLLYWSLLEKEKNE